MHKINTGYSETANNIFLKREGEKQMDEKKKETKQKKDVEEIAGKIWAWMIEHPYLAAAIKFADLAVIIGTPILIKKLRRHKSKKICSDNWAEFNGLKVYDTDVAEFVEKHLKGADKKDIYKIVSATLWTHGIMEGFGGSEPIPEGKWYFFKDI